jgi:hypothetical protein
MELICVSFTHVIGAGMFTGVDGIAPTAVVPLLDTVKLPGSRNVLLVIPELGMFEPIDTASKKDADVGLLRVPFAPVTVMVPGLR